MHIDNKIKLSHTATPLLQLRGWLPPTPKQNIMEAVFMLNNINIQTILNTIYNSGVIHVTLTILPSAIIIVQRGGEGESREGSLQVKPGS